MAGTPLANEIYKSINCEWTHTSVAVAHFITASFISFPPSYPGTFTCSEPIWLSLPVKISFTCSLHQIINCVIVVYHNCDTIHRNHCRESNPAASSLSLSSLDAMPNVLLCLIRNHACCGIGLLYLNRCIRVDVANMPPSAFPSEVLEENLPQRFCLLLVL